ncbi:hypothetical protein [Anaerovorax sp. IOR16]|uniref:hypothetical protein n=1 Tax=Anaerovorax sp. IOR16 TaxID=2773458 RepID=UPI0019CF8207|nr:hypothetical protein [Anaerovorax sp. IOR16]
MNKIRKKVLMTEFKRRICELDAESIAYYRRNPCIASEDLLGIKLIDAQRYILQSSWNTPHCVWCCSRNFGKSFIGAIFMILKAILYENQAIYIVSSVGSQSKETFGKIEEIVLNIGKTAASIKSLKDIVRKETKKSPNNKTGFSHAPESYTVEFYNGSEIFTLNGKPDNNRSKRSTLVFFDEAAFSSDELISACEAFATQNTDFTTSTDESYNPETETRKVPTQLIYASSQDEMDKMFYKHYKNYAKRMLAGDRNYFVCDMICDTAIKTFMDGKPYVPLLTQSKVDSAMKANKEKALREYYNQPTRDGGVSQIIKWHVIRRNESFYLPQLYWKPNNKIALAFDPARTMDNSILGAMNLYQDDELGWCGDIVNYVNFIDIASKKKYKLDSNRQLDEIRQIILNYNGNHPDYEYLDSLMIDQGAGGGGTSTYADGLLNDWNDKTGRTHRGLIDANHDIYAGYSDIYPNAIDKLRLISPRKYRTQMVEEFIELMNLGVIKLPYEFKGQDFIKIIKKEDNNIDEEEFETYDLSDDEMLSLTQIDLMKNEITSIHRFKNPEGTSVSYALSKEKENKMHDDRFYVAIMLAHRLHEIRRGQIINKTNNEADLSSLPSCVSSVDF